MTRYSRSALADAVAIDRIDYEDDVRSRGYGEAAFQPLPVFCKDVVKGMLRGGAKIAGCSYSEGTYGPYYELRVDWQELARVVERRLPRWRETAARVAAGSRS